MAVDRHGKLPSFPNAKGGGCANLVDDAHGREDKEAMIQMVSLEGSYGQIWRVGSKGSIWRIEQSTIPWREEQQLALGGIILENGKPKCVILDGDEWIVMECTFPSMVLDGMFTASSKI